MVGISYFCLKEFLINSEKEIMEADSGPFRYALSISLSVFALVLFIYYIPLWSPPHHPHPTHSDPVKNVIVANNSYTDY